MKMTGPELKTLKINYGLSLVATKQLLKEIGATEQLQAAEYITDSLHRVDVLLKRNDTKAAQNILIAIEEAITTLEIFLDTRGEL